MIPLKNRTAHIVAETLIHTVISIFSLLKLLIVGKDSAFTGDVITFILTGINYQVNIICLFNHGSLRIEQQIQNIGKIMAKHLIQKGEMWSLFAAVVAYVISTFASSSFLDFSPF